MHDLAGTVLADRYRLERELGRGGMGAVWLAQDLRHERAVAIKLLHPDLAAALGPERFIREIRITAQLQHPNVVALLDSGVLAAPDGTAAAWYAMPFLDGESLRARLTREPQLPVGEALAITEAVGSALHAAHQRGIVHRDIKPENVFLAGGQVYVVDFGIAKALIDGGADRLTGTGMVIGTPAYMSPEQATADRIDHRTDQYSLATMLYEMLAGEPPYPGSNPQSITARRLTEPPRALRPVRSAVPEALERAILKALERAPADRFADVASFIAAIRTGAGAAARTEPRPFRVSRALAVAAVAVVIIVSAWLVLPGALAGRASETNPEVVALYQRGVRAYDRRTPAGILEAVSAFGAAVARDSNYSPAWAGLAKAYMRAYGRAFALAGMSRDSMLRAAVAAADRALVTDSASADAWVTRAVVSRFVDPTNTTTALRAARRSVELDSTSALGWHTLAIALADSGNLAAGTEHWRRCVRAAPWYTECLAFLGLAYYWHRQYDSAARWTDSAIAVDPNYLLGLTTSGFIALERGDYDQARAHFDAASRLVTDVEAVNALAQSALAEARAGSTREARALLRTADSLAAGYPESAHTVVYVAQAHAALGEVSRAVALLERFRRRRDLHFQIHLRCDPPMDPLRNDRRFQALLLMPSDGRGC